MRVLGALGAGAHTLSPVDPLGIRARGSTVGTEVRAGAATFLTMAYILFVNPQILEAGGMPREASIAATALAAAVSTLVMGLYSGLPVAMAPGMGLNAFFAFTVCGAMGHPWPTALGIVLLSGLANVVLAYSRLRDWIIDAIPEGMKLAIAVGIGLFLVLIGLQQMGVVAAHPATMIGRGDLGAARSLVGMAGLAATAILLVRGVRGAILMGIVGTAVAALVLGLAEPPARIVAPPPDIRPVLLAFDLRGALRPELAGVVLAFLFVDLFDSVGTLLAVARPCGIATTSADPAMRRALRADAIGTVIGAAAGTSSTTSYIESAAGVEEGGRTGAVSLTVAALFLLALPFYPFMAAVPPFATAPALVAVGLSMARAIREIDFDDPGIGLPAILAISLMPFTFSISTGIGLGLAAYVVVAAGRGRLREIHPALWAIVAVFVATLATGG